MTRSRMVLGGAVLALLLGGYMVIAWCRNAAAPSPVVVTRDPAAVSAPSPPRVPPRLAAPPAARPALVEARPAASQPAIQPAAGAGAAPVTEIAEPIMVHVVGAVKRPGVYRLPPKARFVDAVHAAGGPKAGADLEAVNLASFVQDGEQLRVPALSERHARSGLAAARPGGSRVPSSERPARPVRSTAQFPLAEPEPAGASPGADRVPGGRGKKDGGLVDINTADEEELKTLPGVGPKTAEAILAYRQEHGPFQRPEDLMEIRGIGPKKLARMRDRLVVR